MTTTIANTTTETEATKTRVLGVPGLVCPDCHEAESLVIQVENAVIKCANCDEDFDPEGVSQRLADESKGWARLAAWINAAPVQEDARRDG